MFDGRFDTKHACGCIDYYHREEYRCSLHRKLTPPVPTVTSKPLARGEAFRLLIADRKSYAERFGTDVGVMMFISRRGHSTTEINDTAYESARLAGHFALDYLRLKAIQDQADAFNAIAQKIHRWHFTMGGIVQRPRHNGLSPDDRYMS